MRLAPLSLDLILKSARTTATGDRPVDIGIARGRIRLLLPAAGAGRYRADTGDDRKHAWTTRCRTKRGHRVQDLSGCDS